MTQSTSSIQLRYVALAGAILAACIGVLIWMGQPAICKCGFIKLWHGVVVSSENSQHITDWYSPSHFIHGLLFYGALAWLLGSISVGARLSIAMLVESVWEIFENTDFIINRYREATIALDYFGDSVLNSTSDILFMVIGFIVAWRAPIWLSVLLILVLELTVGFIIRDNLTLNIIMLLYPVEAIKTWQMG